MCPLLEARDIALPSLASCISGKCLGQPGGLSCASSGSYPPVFVKFLLVLELLPILKLYQHSCCPGRADLSILSAKHVPFLQGFTGGNSPSPAA